MAFLTLGLGLGLKSPGAVAAAVPGVTRYVLAGGAGLQNGTSWANAWPNVTSVTGLPAGGGHTIEIGSLVDGTTYAVSNWTPVSGVFGNPNIYRIAQDGTHSKTVFFDSMGDELLNGTFTNVTIDGRYLGAKMFTADDAFGYLLRVPGGSGYQMNVKLHGFNSTSLIFCYGWNLEVSYNTLTSPVSGLDDSLIQHIGDDDPSPSWGKNLIHHNVITVKRAKLTGSGWDAIKWGQGLSIYDNAFLSVYDAAYAGPQHNDALQVSGNYVSVYNNYFENWISYVWLNEIFDASQAHGYRFFNNICYYSNEAGIDWTAQAILAFGGNGSTQAGASLTDLIVANNLFIADAPGIKGCFITHLSGSGIFPAAGAGVYLVNNAANNFTPITQVGAGIVSNNINDPSVAEVTSRALYPTGDFHPTSLSIAMNNAGISPSYLTALFTTDKDGNTRSGTWDVGPYINSNPPPTSVTETFSLLANSSNFSSINPPGWTLRTGEFRTGSGGTAGMVSSNSAGIISVASYEPAASRLPPITRQRLLWARLQDHRTPKGQPQRFRATALAITSTPTAEAPSSLDTPMALVTARTTSTP